MITNRSFFVAIKKKLYYYIDIIKEVITCYII